MKEKILALLKTKYTGVSDTILDRIAEKLSKTVTTEEQVEPAVIGAALEVMNAYADQRVNQANETTKTKAIKEYEETHGLKDGKPIKPEDDIKPDPDKKEEKPQWAIDLEKKLEDTAKENEALKKQTKNAERGVLISTTAKNLGIKDVYMKLVSFPEDATDEDIKTKLTEYQQELITNGLMTKTDAEILSSKQDAEKETAQALVDEILVDNK